MKKLFLIFIISTFCNCSGNLDSSDVNIKDSNLTKNSSDIQIQKDYNIILQKLNSGENTVANRTLLLQVVRSYSDLNAYRKSNIANRVFFKYSTKAKDTLSIGFSHYYFGNNFFNLNKLDSAYYNYIKAEKYLNKRGLLKELSNVYLNKSTIQIIISDFSGAEFSATQALKIFREQQNYLGQYDAFTNLGIASNGNENYENAIRFYQKALETAENNNLNSNYYLTEISLNNIGNAYLSSENYEESIAQFRKALKNKKIFSIIPSLYATLIDNLAYASFKNNSEISEVKNLLFRSLEIRDSLNLSSKVIYSKIHISEYFYYYHDTINAQKFAKDALILAQEINTTDDLLRSLKQLSIVEPNSASKYSSEYIQISDSLQLEERKSKDKFARIAFETDELLIEKDKLAEQNRSLLYFFVATLLIGLLLFVIRNQRARNRELLLIQSQQKANEDIYNIMISQQSNIEESRIKEKRRIAQELHDGILGRLFGARLNLDSLNKFTDNEAVKSRYNYLNELKNIEQDIREISHDLNREKFALINNFFAILSNLLEEQKNSYDPELLGNIDKAINWDIVSNAVKINLYRITQEALQNINKYARAQNIVVEIKLKNNFITLRVIDDGIGFDIKSKKKGIGLQNINSRVEECNGEFKITTEKLKGTSIIVLIPYLD